MIGLHFELVKTSLRWLDWMFLGGYPPSLSINFIGMSKDGKKVNKTVYKDENFL